MNNLRLPNSTIPHHQVAMRSMSFCLSNLANGSICSPGGRLSGLTRSAPNRRTILEKSISREQADEKHCFLSATLLGTQFWNKPKWLIYHLIRHVSFPTETCMGCMGVQKRWKVCNLEGKFFWYFMINGKKWPKPRTHRTKPMFQQRGNAAEDFQVVMMTQLLP